MPERGLRSELRAVGRASNPTLNGGLRTHLVPVEQVTPGDTLVLPRGRRCTVQSVEKFDDDTLLVRWRRGDPQHPDGVQFGSLACMVAGELVRVER